SISIKKQMRCCSFWKAPVLPYWAIGGCRLKKSSAIYIPKGVWHGIENPDSELLLLWVVAPPGLEAFFRKVASPPGAPPKQLTREQLNEIARKHGMQFK